MPPPDTGAEPPVVTLARAAMASGVAALTAGDTGSALRWLERAHRLVPHDTNTTLTLASACLATDPARAASLFGGVVEKYDVRQGWLGLAAARCRLNQPEQAKVALAAVLSRHAFVPDAASLAEQIGGRSGWCGLRADGGLEIHAVPADRVRILLDGKPVRGKRLPAGWARGRTVEVRVGGTNMLGSPIGIGAIRRLAGCVEVCDGGIRGWAWHPGDPDTAPELTLTYSNGGREQTFVAHDRSVTVLNTGPLARPRSFHLTPADLLDAPGPIHVRGLDGKDMPGSPLDPFAGEAARIADARRLGQLYPASQTAAGDPTEADLAHWNPGSINVSPGFAEPPATSMHPAPRLSGHSATPTRARSSMSGHPGDRTVAGIARQTRGPVAGLPVGADGRRRAATIVIPVHDGGAVILSCLASVLASAPAEARVLVVDDGSSDPVLIAALDDLVRRRKITLLRHARALGFPSSANAGIQAAKGRDVVLLNSDTLVPPGWLERLRIAAYAAPDIGTVTPLSNEASILSYPGAAGTNPRPGQADTNRLDRRAERANGSATVDIPVGVGFCLYLRRDCLNATGSFRTGLFAQGYGEENDLCLRARVLGWRNVALTGLFVGHLGGTTFGGNAMHLRQRNGRIVEQLHPGHQALIDRFLATDPLAEPRRRMDLLAWKERGRKWRQATILITHNDGGGVERRLAHSAETHARAGCRPIVLRPAEMAGEESAIAVHDGIANNLPNLVFAVPRELPALLRLLRAARATSIEAHHLADYPPAIYDLVSQLGIPYDVHVHDYAWFCPRISLVAAHNRYCGEPDLHDCESCVADNGHFLKENIAVAALRSRSARFLGNAGRVVVPADDTGIRMRRHLPGLSTVTVPHEDDDLISHATAPRFAAARAEPRRAGHARPSVCVVGAIGVHKGFEVLLACARDAARRGLDLDFVVVGHTIDDARLMATGRVFVTGRFDPAEAVDLIAAQQAQIGFVPSICPETWCLSLGDIWRAGLSAAAFDIGAPAERIRRTGRGIVLPLGLPANAINNSLVAAIHTVRHR
jgi:GT2 family glycosyltransferase